MASSKDVAERHFKELLKYPNVLSVTYHKKFVNGVKTDIDCISVFVSRKVAEEKLTPAAKIPKMIEGIPTDVVEFASDFVMGETSASRKSPAIQRRIGGGVVR
jgi:hypothetical protein